MKLTRLDLYLLDGVYGNVSLPDFQIGKVKLAKHLNNKGSLIALVASTRYARQLLLKMPPDLPSGRVPLYVCRCCGDLGCGALTVQVEKTEGYFIWRDFAYENNWGEGYIQTDYMKRTGPFQFPIENYRSTIKPYAKALRNR